jgi:hypothetical protein
MEVDGADKRGDRIKRGLLRGGRGSKERVRDMTRNKNALNTEIDPCGRYVRKINPPFFFAFVGMRFEDKPVNILPLAQKAFVILPVMLISDLGIQPKEWR